MKTVVTSDFHIKFYENNEDKERRVRVEDFLKSLINNIDCLILAGDIFDLWIEWNTVIIKNYYSILKIFSDLRNSGCKIIFITGNHDFYLDNFLVDIIGCEVYKDYYTTQIDGKKIFVSHGDLFTKNDNRYKIFRSVIRSPFIRYLCKIIHPDIILKLGNCMSRTKKQNDFDKNYNKKEQGLIEKAVLLSNDFDIIVFGHSHKPMCLNINNSIYLNCGDWIQHNSFVYIHDAVATLKKQKLN